MLWLRKAEYAKHSISVGLALLCPSTIHQKAVMGKKAKNRARKHGSKRAWRWSIDPFYHSPEWIELRKQVLKKYGATCMICGRSKKDGAAINVDHIMSRKRWPSKALDFENMGVLCGYHNKIKGNEYWGDYRKSDWIPNETAKSALDKGLQISGASIQDLTQEQREHLRSI
jgi:5-methylcytosine-specific restriction endonuclease McrA